jgi:hypothetical protein
VSSTYDWAKRVYTPGTGTPFDEAARMAIDLARKDRETIFLNFNSIAVPVSDTDNPSKVKAAYDKRTALATRNNPKPK